MPLENVPIVDDREAGRTVSGWAWGPRLRIDLTSPERAHIALEADCYHSEQAAYDGVSRPVTRSFLISGAELAAVLGGEPSVILGLVAMIDQALQERLGGEATPPALPAWLAPPDPEP